MPQIMMLNHAAWLERENSDMRYEHKRKVEEWKKDNTPEDPYIDEFGKPMSEMTEEQMNHYFADWRGFG